jgi:DNA modification methylase
MMTTDSVFCFPPDLRPMPEILVGNCLDVLRGLPDNSIDCCVTSPPFFGLRDYLTGSWQGGDDPLCTHSTGRGTNVKQTKHPNADNYPASAPHRGGDSSKCSRCGAIRIDDQIGLESTPTTYVEKLVDVFHEVYRILKEDGTLWLNLGDSYSNDTKWGGNSGGKHAKGLHGATGIGRGRRETGLKPKDMIGIPWSVAFALRDDGWYLRSDIIWAKVNPMPECLSPDTMVFIRENDLTARVNLDSILSNGKPYPKILTPDGWRSIVNIWETTKDIAVSFDASSTTKVVCSLEHTWPVSYDRRSNTVHDLPTAQLKDIGYKHYLLHHTIDKWLDEKITVFKDQILDYDLGFLVGLYAAEGGFGEKRGCRCKLTMHAKEAAILDQAESIITRFYPPTISRQYKNNYISLRFSSMKWRSFVLAIIKGKCSNKSVAIDFVLNTPRVFRQGIWNGYILGDGSPRPAGGCGAASASRLLRDDMCVLASSIGLITSKGDYSTIDTRTGKTYQNFQLWTPYIKKLPNTQSGARHLTIRNKHLIEGPHRMIDIQVDGGLFLVDDGLVTHNSVQDRPTSSYEHVFLLTKCSHYFYDDIAIREATSSVQATVERNGRADKGLVGAADLYRDGFGQSGNGGFERAKIETRNARNVWSIPTKPYHGAHFATMPLGLVQKCVLAGSSEKGCCASCGKPWRRVQASWAASCVCQADVVPSRVLDPFGGAGTTGLVARRLGRHSILIELNPDYADLARDRISNDKF